MHYVYLLKLNNNSYYTGSTSDLKTRIKEHENGEVISTAGHRPIALIFYSAFDTKQKAITFEKYLKTGSGQAFRNKRLI